MRIYDLYGFLRSTSPSRLGNIENVHSTMRLLSRELHLAFVAHESSYQNGLYYTHRSAEMGVVDISNNVADDPDDLRYPNYLEYPVIVSTTASPRADYLRDVLAGIGFEHLRRRRRGYVERTAAPAEQSERAVVDVYGVPAALWPASDQINDVALWIGSRLGLAFDGNEGAFDGRDDHFYDESNEFGDILILDNRPDRWGVVRFPEFAEIPATLVVRNARNRDSIHDMLLKLGLHHLRHRPRPEGSQ